MNLSDHSFLNLTTTRSVSFLPLDEAGVCVDAHAMASSLAEQPASLAGWRQQWHQQSGSHCTG